MDTNFKKILLETNNIIWAKDYYLYNQELVCIHTLLYSLLYNHYGSKKVDSAIGIELESIYHVHSVNWNKIST